MDPQRTYGVLTSDIPDRELDIFVLYSFYIKAYRRYGRDYLTQHQLVQDGRLSCCIKTYHQDPDFLLAEQLLEQRHRTTHSRDSVSGEIEKYIKNNKYITHRLPLPPFPPFFG